MKNLVNLISIAVLVLCMANTSCDKLAQTTIMTADFGEQFEIETNELIIIPGAATELQIDLKSIVDSRCPANAICVWAGNATVKIDIRFPGADSISRELCIGTCQVGANIPGSSTVTANGKTYTISLLEVKPFPTIDKPGNTTKSAVFVVTKN